MPVRTVRQILRCTETTTVSVQVVSSVINHANVVVVIVATGMAPQGDGFRSMQ